MMHVRIWHETDMPKYLGNVRCWVNSGKHLLALSFSAFDPSRTSTSLRDFARKAPSAPSGALLARAPHSITSLASASSVGGTVRPSAFAVLRLMTSSNFVGRSTGRSDGFAPLRNLIDVAACTEK